MKPFQTHSLRFNHPALRVLYARKERELYRAEARVRRLADEAAELAALVREVEDREATAADRVGEVAA